jgi:hypothetical protein
MPKDRKRLTQYLDQLLPFLEAAPGWFKIWLYVLVALIGVTVVAAFVFYLNMRDRQFTARSFDNFQITTPKNGGEIAISETKSLLVHGRFPVFAASDGSSPADTSVSLKVERLPHFESVPQENSNAVGPTADGVWHAKVVCPNEGRYRVMAIGHIGKQLLVREVTVDCIDKASLFAKQMRVDRAIRGVGQIPHRPPAIIDKNMLVQQLSNLQRDLVAAFSSNDWTQALTLVTQALDLIDPALLYSPDDLYFQNQRAYFFKNYAIVMRKMKREDEVSRSLLEAETMFKAVLDQEQKDPSAWNGMGSVLIIPAVPTNRYSKEESML